MKLKITLFLFIRALYFADVSAQCSADYEEVNGIVIIEAESKTAGSWSLRNLSGASGGQALYYAGSNQFNNPGTSAITYTLRVNNPGLYRVQMRSQIGVISTGPEPATSEHNDTWLRINGSEFYGQNGNSIVWPRGSGITPIVAVSSGDGWLKAYTNQLGWTWNTFTNDGPGHSIYVRFASAGTYNVQISGRSKDHIVDRIVLYQQSLYSTSQATDLSRAETTCGTTTPPPPAENVAPTVSITSPSNGCSFDEGANITVNLSANDADGSIQRHEIFVNNSSVDIDNGNYTPYVLANAQAGSYAIRATVTDNDGATASSTVNITVNENTPPPPPPTNNAPTLNITYPADGQSFEEGSNFTVNLNSRDVDGTVAKHEVIINGGLVSSQGSEYTPYLVVDPQPGNIAIRVVVTDNDGATTASSINVNITEIAPPPPPVSVVAPSVSITNPSNGQTFEEGANITINLDASDSDGTIVKHEIAIDDTVVDTDDGTYTPYVIVDAQPGNYTITAEVTDNDGATASSSILIIVNENTPPPPPETNEAPILNITYPLNGQTFDEGSDFTVNLNSRDTDGSVEKHEVFINGALVSSQGNDYTPYLVVDPQAGTYVIGVTITDNQGETATSAVTVNVEGEVAPPPPPPTDEEEDTNGISLFLVDALNNGRTGSLESKSYIDESQTMNSNIEAVAPEGTKSVRFELSGAGVRNHIENFAPYALFGDLEGDFYSGRLESGFYDLRVKAYNQPNGAGNIIAEIAIGFTITNSGAGRTAIAFPNPVKADGRVSIRLPEGSQGDFKYILTNSKGTIIDKGVLDAQEAERNFDLQLPNVGRQVEGVYFLSLMGKDFRQSIPIIRK